MTQIQQVLSFRQAAALLGVNERTISDLVKARGIAPLPHPSNGKAKGLDVEALKTIRKALRGR